MFPKAFLSKRAILESHVRSFRQSARRRAADIRGGRPALITSAPLSDIVQAIQAHVDAHLEFTTSELRAFVLALLEERLPLVVTAGFQASHSWLNKLRLHQMQLRMRTIGTNLVAVPITSILFLTFSIVLYVFAVFACFSSLACVPCFLDELEARHWLVLLRLA